jgi:hypothetical protein
MKSLSVLNAFSSAGCTKSYKFERVMMMGEMEGFPYFSKKRSNLV